jgi:hypothetical protein
MAENEKELPKQHVIVTCTTRTTQDFVLAVLGLASLLKLQYDHEGHMDAHVHALFTEWLHIMGLELTNGSQADLIDDVPF